MCCLLPYGIGTRHYAFLLKVFFLSFFLIFGCFYCFCPFLFIFLFSLALINWMEWSVIPAHPSLYAFVTRTVSKGRELFKTLCLMLVCVCVVFKKLSIYLWIEKTKQI